MSGNHVSILRPAIEAFVSADHERWRREVRKIFTSDAEWHSAFSTVPRRGHDQIGFWLEEMTSGFTGFHSQLNDIEDWGDRVLSFHRFRGTLNATGAEVEQETGVVWEFDGDKCVRATTFVGWDEARAAATRARSAT